jgi:hypothetical protein
MFIKKEQTAHAKRGKKIAKAIVKALTKIKAEAQNSKKSNKSKVTK